MPKNAHLFYSVRHSDFEATIEFMCMANLTTLLRLACTLTPSLFIAKHVHSQCVCVCSRSLAMSVMRCAYAAHYEWQRMNERECEPERETERLAPKAVLRMQANKMTRATTAAAAAAKKIHQHLSPYIMVIRFGTSCVAWNRATTRNRMQKSQEFTSKRIMRKKPRPIKMW